VSADAARVLISSCERELGFCRALEAIWATRAEVFSFCATGETPKLLGKQSRKSRDSRGSVCIFNPQSSSQGLISTVYCEDGSRSFFMSFETLRFQAPRLLCTRLAEARADKSLHMCSVSCPAPDVAQICIICCRLDGGPWSVSSLRVIDTLATFRARRGGASGECCGFENQAWAGLGNLDYPDRFHFEQKTLIVVSFANPRAGNSLDSSTIAARQNV